MDNDYELLYMAKEHNEEAIEFLYKKYYNTIYRKARQYSKSTNIFFYDYLNEAILAFYKAIDNYQDKNSFKTYLIICLDSSLKNFYKSEKSQKNKILNESISINEENENIYLAVKSSKYNPEEILEKEETYHNFKKKVVRLLTWKEELVFNLRLENYSPKEISEITDNNLKTVYNIIKRIRNKIVKLVS